MTLAVYKVDILVPAKHTNLLEHYQKITSDIDNTKVHQISMVDSQVNHKFYKKMVKNQKSKGFHT